MQNTGELCYNIPVSALVCLMWLHALFSGTSTEWGILVYSLCVIN
nr:MAG TPA: hypothetical protein [Caudoviricetes sp.]